MTGPEISEVEVAAYTVPTDAPEADGTYAWQQTTMIVVQVRAGDQLGTGWTYGSMAVAALIRQTLAPLLIGRRCHRTGAVWSAMVAELRNIGRPGLGAMAVSAVDCAVWDLKARTLGLPLHELLGAPVDAVPLYGSGGFTSYTDEQTTAQLRGWVDQGLPRVKIKIGESWGSRVDRDLERVRLAREVIGPETELFVDANGGYTEGQAVRVGHQLDELGVTWFEEPVSSDDLAGLREVRGRLRLDVTAGEYGYGLDYFRRMCVARAVDCLQVDITRCGGITELLRIAAVADAHHLQVSGHCAPFQHASALAALPNLRHLEWFHDHVRLERWFFTDTTDPVDGSLPLTDRPGIGWEFQPHLAQPYRVF